MVVLNIETKYYELYTYPTYLDEHIVTETICVRFVEGVCVYARINDQYCKGVEG